LDGASGRRRRRLPPPNAFYGELFTAGRVDGTGGLSPKTVREIHAIVHKALKDAVRWGRVNRNVAALADPPSQRSAATARRRTMQTWAPRELRRFLTEDLDERLGYAWVLADTTGLRRSELARVALGRPAIPSPLLPVANRGGVCRRTASPQFPETTNPWLTRGFVWLRGDSMNLRSFELRPP
jgi:hypothetical protein